MRTSSCDAIVVLLAEVASLCTFGCGGAATTKGAGGGGGHAGLGGTGVGGMGKAGAHGTGGIPAGGHGGAGSGGVSSGGMEGGATAGAGSGMAGHPSTGGRGGVAGGSAAGAGGGGGAAGSASTSGGGGAGGVAGDCLQVTTLAACEARGDCHSVFLDPGSCACPSLGCCAQFSRCAAGDKAMCTAQSTVVCGAATPHCEGIYAVAYTATCFEGCVQEQDCAP